MKRSLWLACLFAGCAAGPPELVDGASGAIVNGTLETGRPEVVFMYRTDGAACSASIISPYVVLTAAHCVQSGSTAAPASRFRIYVGSSTRQFTTEYRVSSVRLVARAGVGREANDLAVLVLSSPARETPIELGRGSPQSSLPGRALTAVGYGQTPSGGSGTKYTVGTRFDGYQNGYIFVPPTVCSGDSGGPLIGDDGRVYGVASFIYSPDGRTEPRCGTAPGAYNEIYRHLDFIDAVLEETGTCVPSPSGGEACNGVDDDCDGEVDEGCIELGSPCERSDECYGGLCADTVAGRLCTSECDALRPDQGCGPGFYCASGGGCGGFCVRGAAGTGLNDADCASNTDCMSLFCHDPGDGRRRCLDPCRADGGLCFAGEVCPATPGSCSGCVPAEIVAFPRGLGEPCTTDAECRDAMVCVEYARGRECSRPCTDHASCGEGFECRDGMCRVDRRQGVGGVCVDNPDCGEAVCATQGERAWCTAQCTAASECPSGFDCVDAGGVTVCAPMGNLDGEDCASNDDCTSGLCATIGADSFCTSWCDPRNPCAPGFACYRTGTGAAVCVPIPAETSGGGCRVDAGPNGAGWPLGIALAGLAALVLARRRARRAHP
ncbi:MAG: trypsin-like serine protease [Sandaracinaceae bacterium]|nr:trypsin-like serine protease [Sandaracinaceae bacterium]